MTTQQELTPELIRAALTTVKFPGFSRDIVSFGLVKKIDIDAENNVTIDLVIESKNADIPRYIFEGVHGVMKHLPGVKHCDVNIEHKAPEARKGINDDPSTWKSSVPGAKHVIAVASGKGGVGKSTVSANLAVALSKLGYSVGLVDLDIYGPSMSLMFGTKERPGANENDEFIPVTAHGVKLLSMGLLINESDPVAVRGPLATRYVQQFLRNVAWGDVDFLILDLPPGTGDIQLTIVQTAELDGVVVVTTPQEVALIDARKAIGLFERVETPILGIIENMSYSSAPLTARFTISLAKEAANGKRPGWECPCSARFRWIFPPAPAGTKAAPWPWKSPGRIRFPPRSARWLNNAPVWCLTAECPDGAGGPVRLATFNFKAGLEPAALVRLVCRHVPAF